MKIFLDSFLTGSRRYGKPRAGSDHDYVVLISKGACSMFNLTENTSSKSFRVENLNLIVCPDTERGRLAYATWKNVTESLCREKPVSRDYAVSKFQEAFITTGLAANY